MKIWTPNLLDVMPESLLRDPKLRASAEALSVELAKLSAATREVLHIPRLDELSGKILDHLNEQVHTDFYEPLFLSDEQKRSLIRNSIAWHRIKGTPAAVEEVVNRMFDNARVVEWFDYGGEPYHFKLETNEFRAEPEEIATLLRMINVAKNVRSVLDDITIDYSDTLLKEPIPVHVGIAQNILGQVKIAPTRPDDLLVARPKIGSAIGVMGGVDVRPNLPTKFLARLKIGNTVFLTGEIKIGSETKPRVEPDYRFNFATVARPKIGTAQSLDGLITIRPHLPKIFPVRMTFATTETLDGEVVINPHVPKKFSTRQKFGSAITLGGEIVVGSETKPHVTPEKVLSIATVARPKIGTVEILEGTATIEPHVPKNFVARPAIGSALFLCGEIVIGSETKPHTQPTHDVSILARASTKVPEVEILSGEVSLNPDLPIKFSTRTKFGAAEILEGGVVIRPGLPTETIAQLKTSATIVISGEIIIKPARNSLPPDVADFINGDWLRIYFDFPTGRDHPVLLQNPRGDLLVADIKDVGDFADANNLFSNSRAEDTIGIHRAELIRGFNLTLAKDSATLPTADSLRLFFDFPTGNKRRILLHNIRGGITAGELRRLGEGHLLKNAYNQATSGVTHAALIKNFDVNESTITQRVKFKE